MKTEKNEKIKNEIKQCKNVIFPMNLKNVWEDINKIQPRKRNNERREAILNKKIKIFVHQ